MGYGQYTLPDGREAGYLVEAECDMPGCTLRIDRGLGYLCGELPDGHRDDEAAGCGKYYCEPHLAHHDCSNPGCDAWDEDETAMCALAKDHDLPHRDRDGDEFTEVAP